MKKSIVTSLLLCAPLLAIAAAPPSTTVPTQFDSSANIAAQLNLIRLGVNTGNESLSQNQNNTLAIKNQLSPSSNSNVESFLDTGTGYNQISSFFNDYKASNDYASMADYADSLCQWTNSQSTCEANVLKANANNVIPLLRIGSPSKTSDSTGSPTHFTLNGTADSYINALIDNSDEEANVMDPNVFPSVNPQLSMAQGVLKSINNDYKDGLISKITSASQAAFSPKWISTLQTLSTADAIHLIAINQAKMEFLETLAARQRQKSNGLSAVELVQLVKLQLSSIQQGQEIQKSLSSINKNLSVIAAELKQNQQ